MPTFNEPTQKYPIIYPRQVIFGKVPSKSNAYKIIKLPGKKERVECPDCGGYKMVPKCKECEGMGFVYLATKEIYSLGKTTVLQRYEKAFALQCTKYRNLMIDGSIRFVMDVYFERLASDVDGSLKIVLDCLSSKKLGVCAMINDNRVDKLVIDRYKDKLNPRIEFHIEVLGPSAIKGKKVKSAPKKPIEQSIF